MTTLISHLCASALAVALLTAFSDSPAARQAPTPAKPIFGQGQAQVVPAFEDNTQWIRETLFVETDFDSDRDGRHDRMFVDVTRQRQSETEGLKVTTRARQVSTAS